MSECILITCSDSNGIPSYLGSFNSQNGLVFRNAEMSFVTTGGEVTIPEGSIIIPVPDEPKFISYKGCRSVVTLPVPVGSTPLQIADIVNQVMFQVAQQQAECDAGQTNPAIPPADGGGSDGGGGGGGGGGGSPSIIYYNSAVMKSCSTAPQMKLVGALPGFVTFSISGLTAAASSFASYVSVADANAAADSFLGSLIANGSVKCGWWNEEQTFDCPYDTTRTVAAGQIFSEISQDDANDLALEQAEFNCICNAVLGITWVSGTPQGVTSWSQFQNTVTINISGLNGALGLRATMPALLVGKKMACDVVWSVPSGSPARLNVNFIEGGGVQSNIHDVQPSPYSGHASCIYTGVFGLFFYIDVLLDNNGASPTTMNATATFTFNCDNN